MFWESQVLRRNTTPKLAPAPTATADLYEEVYCARGKMENRITLQATDLAAAAAGRPMCGVSVMSRCSRVEPSARSQPGSSTNTRIRTVENR